jgi:BirA family transcriptional regulator, biotin operon repressor / biotin---[acetyl-CoA-carboxylase] ligase
MSSDIDQIHHVILGIGLNVNVVISHLPVPLRRTATSLADIYGRHISRVKLVQCLLTELENVYQEFLASGFSSIRKEWLLLSTTIGSEVSVISGTDTIRGKAVDIDKDGFLLVKEPDGHIIKIVSGDVIPANRPENISS